MGNYADMYSESLHHIKEQDREIAKKDKRIEELETDSKDGWDKYRELRKEVAQDKYPSLTNDVETNHITDGDK